MKRIIFSAVACGVSLLICFAANAQHHEFSVAAADGKAGLQYEINNGSGQLQNGYQAGVGYTRFLDAHWGIVTGVALGYYHTRATLSPDKVFTSYAVDDEGNAFEFRVRTRGYEEVQKLYALNVPLLMQYQTVPAARMGFYSSAGLKLSLPLKASFSARAEEVSASGYYPDVNAEFTELPSHGFGTQTNWNGKGDYDFKLSYAMATEAGARFTLSAGRYLYAGLFLDYGLNNIKKQDGGESLINYEPTGLSQSHAGGVLSVSNTGDVHLVAYGIRLRMALSFIGKGQ